MNCEKCETEIFTSIEGSCLAVRCPNCGWSLVTTYIDKIHSDSTIYTITIINIPDPTIPQIRLVAKLANVNWLQVKDMLAQDEMLLVQERAPKIKQVVSLLTEANIPYRIFPDYTY